MKRSSQLTVLSLHWCLCFCFGRHLACNIQIALQSPSSTKKNPRVSPPLLSTSWHELTVDHIFQFQQYGSWKTIQLTSWDLVVYLPLFTTWLFGISEPSTVWIPCSVQVIHNDARPNLSVRDGTALYKTPAVAGQWWIWQNPRYDAGFQINLFNLFVYKPNKWQKSQKSIKIIKIQIWSKPPASWLFHIRHPFQIEPPPGEALHCLPLTSDLPGCWAWSFSTIIREILGVPMVSFSTLKNGCIYVVIYFQGLSNI